MNIKKLFATLAGVSLFAQTVVPFGALAATYSQELQDAYDWAYGKGVTTMSPIDNANMYGAITRAEMAKMLSVYAKEVLGNTPDTSKACTFSDIDSVKGDLHEFIIESCQLGIMGQGITAFRPYDTISRAEFGTALSRVLWGDQYEGGTPYYAKHLDALKAAGIMTQIDNPENRDEIRGYVMLMLMRSEEGSNNPECQDPLVKVACAMDSEECPAACKEGAKDEDGKPIAKGDLEVTADAAANTKILASGTSDLDTITFKTSESVDINKVTLERYGYSTGGQVVEVRLEDQDGNQITEPKGLTKDKVTLSIKKGYRTVDGKFEATLVVTTDGAAGSMGFKVTDVDSTAANLNLDSYKANLYDVVDYQAETVYVEIKGTEKAYNYEEGKTYEVARVQVKAGNAAIVVKGLTLTNGADKALDMAEFLDELTVTAEGKDVKGLKYSVNKDDELVISFDDVNVDINKKVVFVISASFKDFNAYGDAIQYYVAKTSHVNAIENKNGTRVDLDISKADDKAEGKLHTFNGGKIKLTNTKLGKIDASQGSEDIVVAEGNITVTEPISKMKFDITANNTGVAALRLFIDNDEVAEGTRSATAGGYKFAFSNVEIEKSGKIQFKMDIEDDDAVTGTIKLSPSFGKDAFAGAKYDNAKQKYVDTGDVAGTISFSEVTIQAAKASLKNNLTDDVEFLTETTDKQSVFEGTYTAKKTLINLNKFYMSGATSVTDTDITYHLYINDALVATTDTYGDADNYESFDDVEVKAGASVDVRVEAEVDASANTGSIENVYLVLGGTDAFDKDVQYKAVKVMVMKIVEDGSVNVEAGASKNTVLKTSNNQVLGEFTVKGSNNATTELSSLEFTIAKVTGDDFEKEDIDISSVDIDDCDYDAGKVTCKDMKVSLPETVTVSFNAQKKGEYTLTINSVNGKKQTKTFSKRFEKALVYVKNQEKKGDETVFTLGVNSTNSSLEVSNVKVYVNGAVVTGTHASISDTFADGAELRFANGSALQYIDGISYNWELDGATGDVRINSDPYKDYFAVGKDFAQIFKAGD